MCQHILSSRVIFLLLSCIYLFGCKKDDTAIDPRVNLQPVITPVGTPLGNPVSKTIGSAGGSLTSPDGSFTITIPSGALTNNTNIAIQPVSNEAPGGIGMAYDLLPNGTKFGKPVTLTFHYTDAEVPDNIPYFLFIAYQDNAGAWRADVKLRDFDPVSKTVSLDVDHFTIFTLVDMMPIQASASPLIVREEEKAGVWVIESVVDDEGRITEQHFVPDQLVESWKVNLSINGNPVDGTISGGSKSHVTYTAPASIDQRRTVRVSVILKVNETVYDKGVKVTVSKVERAVNITLEPAKYNYQVKLTMLDSTISPFYGGLHNGLPVYMDTASFDLSLKLNNHALSATISHIKNGAPSVTPSVKTFQESQFIWIPDPNGMINITGLEQNSVSLDPDSTASLLFLHSNAYLYGVMMKGARDGSVHSNEPPQLFGGTVGIPQSIEIDLKKTGPYIIKSGGFGKYMYFAIVPK